MSDAPEDAPGISSPPSTEGEPAAVPSSPPPPTPLPSTRFAPPVPEAIVAGPLPRRVDRRWSGIPVAASLSLVAFSVLFGVYGPRVVDRGTPAIGTPLWEAVDAAAEYLDQFILNAPYRPGEPVAIGEANAALARLLQQAGTCPDLGRHDFVPTQPQSIHVPGAPQSAVVVYSRAGRGGTEYLGLVIAPYHEQFTLFSEFGRPQFLRPGGAVGVDAAPSDRVDSATLAWTNGSLLFVAVGSRRTTLEDVGADLVPSNASHLGAP